MDEKLIHTLLGELQKISRSETIIGEPIQSGEATIVPISRVQIGFGAGSLPPGKYDQDKVDSSRGLGLGGGIRVDPVACVIVDRTGKAQMMQFAGRNSTTVSKVIDMVPEVLERIGLTKEEPKSSESPKTKSKSE